MVPQSQELALLRARLEAEAMLGVAGVTGQIWAYQNAIFRTIVAPAILTTARSKSSANHAPSIIEIGSAASIGPGAGAQLSRADPRTIVLFAST